MAPQRVSNELRLSGTDASPSGVRGVWLRSGVEARYKRLIRLEQHTQGDTIVLTENQIRLLERHPSVAPTGILEPGVIGI